jgi:hypothetical protein
VVLPVGRDVCVGAGRVEARILSMASRFAVLAEGTVAVAVGWIGTVVAGRPFMRSRASWLEEVAKDGALVVGPDKRHLASDSEMSVIWPEAVMPIDKWE